MKVISIKDKDSENRCNINDYDSDDYMNKSLRLLKIALQIMFICNSQSRRIKIIGRSTIIFNILLVILLMVVI